MPVKPCSISKEGRGPPLTVVREGGERDWPGDAAASEPRSGSDTGCGAPGQATEPGLGVLIGEEGKLDHVILRAPLSPNPYKI